MVGKSETSPLSDLETDSLIDILNSVKGSSIIHDLVEKHVSIILILFAVLYINLIIEERIGRTSSRAP